MTGMKQLGARSRIQTQQRQTALARTHFLIDLMNTKPVAAKLGAFADHDLNSIPICRPCADNEQAKVDLINWILLNGMVLPEAISEVSYAHGTYVISISWRDKHSDKSCKLDKHNCIKVSHSP